MRKTAKVQVPKTHYYNPAYLTKQRWASYWYQINEIISRNPKSVLEIGVGNKVVSDCLKKAGIKVTTSDLDQSLKPDVVADVLNLPFLDKSFEIVLCAQVLEHLPFKNFRKALSEIYRVCSKVTIITLPHFSIGTLYLGIKLIPFIPKKDFFLKIDFPVKHKYDGQHYWEIGKKGYNLKLVKSKIKNAGFKIDKTFRPIENPYHHFFILKK